MAGSETVRFSTFNASLNRNNEGELIGDLSTPDNAQAQAVAEIIQRANPDVLLVNEFDYDANGEAAALFQQNYLGVSQNGVDPVEYPYVYLAPSNTGIPSGLDLDNDGTTDGPGDAYGFGFFPGQFGMVVYSKHPIDTANVRTFQNFLWKDMPDALLPTDPEDIDGNGDTENWYTEAELEQVRLSSKSHWDIPIEVDGDIIHVLACHPTPPVFDGPEDRNGTRNFDEIRF
ncbi:MAG: endonuclease/exonuclease/phosphatase family protein, partial [Cyanobacteria bacterium J06659_2]